jgi:hypothetical protein
MGSWGFGGAATIMRLAEFNAWKEYDLRLSGSAHAEEDGVARGR